MSAAKFESVVEYTTKLDNFEGPMDLLLHLLRTAEIDPKDIFVSDVTDQFIDYVSHAEIDMETESEYLVLCASIIEIKSKAIIPNEEIQIEVEQEKADLTRKLEEYKLYKESMEKLRELENTDSFYKTPDKEAGKPKILYNEFNLDGLVKAFMNVMRRASTEEEKSKEKEIPREVFTVTEKAEFIRNILRDRNSISFYELFTPNSTKNEIITTFQAMLELLKLEAIKFIQEEVFGDITILKGDKEEVDLGTIEEYN